MAVTPSPRPRLKPILLPAEHGGWGLIGAPVLLGLAVAPSGAGAWAALAALAAFLARQPLKIAAKDVLQRKRFPRTGWALGFAAGELAVACGALAAAAAFASAALVLPIVVLLALSGIQFSFDALGKGRSALPEIVGACAAASFAPLIALAGGAPARGAWLLGAVLALHAILAIGYITARLELGRGGTPSLAPVWALSAAAPLLAAIAVWIGWAQWPLLAAFGVLSGRALWGVSGLRADIKPKFVGFQEIAYALGLVLATALGAEIVATG